MTSGGERGPVVYVVQNQHRWDDGAGRFVPKFDFSPAVEFGELRYLLDPRETPYTPHIVPSLRERLRGFSDGDFLLLSGNPALIAAAGAIAATYNEGRVSVLLWSNRENRYTKLAMSGLDAQL